MGAAGAWSWRGAWVKEIGAAVCATRLVTIENTIRASTHGIFISALNAQTTFGNTIKIWRTTSCPNNSDEPPTKSHNLMSVQVSKIQL